MNRRRVFSILALAIEEVIMYGFQRSMTGSIGIVEIPCNQRDPVNAQRFKGGHASEPICRITSNGKSYKVKISRHPSNSASNLSK